MKEGRGAQKLQMRGNPGKWELSEHSNSDFGGKNEKELQMLENIRGGKGSDRCDTALGTCIGRKESEKCP